jgi:signal transduction histidine kinase
MSSEPTTSERTPRRRPRSLAIRLTAWYVAVVLGSLLALMLLAVTTVNDAVQAGTTVLLESRIERHVDMIETGGLARYRDAVTRAGPLDDEDLPVRIRDTAGRTVFSHGDLAGARFTAVRTIGVLRLEIGTSGVAWSVIVDHLRFGALAVTLAAIVLSVAGGYHLTRRMLRPVRDLEAVASDVIRSGDLSKRVPVRGDRDEFDRVSMLFNEMLERNEEVVRAMREALDNVAHDLRTPLTRIRGTAEVALRTDDATAAREALAVCIDEADHVLVMLRSLMDISEAQAGLMHLDRADVRLDQLAHDAVELYAHVAEDAGVTLELVSRGPVTVHGDPVRLRQAIANLIDNAIKYTPRGGHVTVTVSEAGDQAIVEVRDTGEGIAAAMIPQIWDRLFRADPSRSKRGLGLGLSLVRAIVEAHGGRVRVDSQPGSGSVFTVALPRVRTPAS